jgi:hypothetical protein
VNQRLQRVARMLLGRNRNPLLRHIDRIEAALLAGLTVAFFFAAPLASIYAGRLADTAALREQHAELSWRQEPATLRQNAAAGLIGLDGAWDTSWVSASWPTPAGGPGHGLVATQLNARKGDVVTVWVDARGQLTRPPLTRADLRDRVAFAVLVATGAVAALLLLIAVAIRVAVNRRRMAGWERAWETTGPKWSRLR